MACFFSRPQVRQRIGYLLAVRGFGDFVTGHRCLGEGGPLRSDRLRKARRLEGRWSCVRESSSPPHTPKGTATLLSCPGPAAPMRDVPGSMPERAQDRNAAWPLQPSARHRVTGRPRSSLASGSPRSPQEPLCQHHRPAPTAPPALRPAAVPPLPPPDLPPPPRPPRPHPRGRPTRGRAPPATSSAGARSAACWSPSCSSCTAPPPAARPPRPSGSPRSRRRAGCCCAGRNGRRHGAAPRRPRRRPEAGTPVPSPWRGGARGTGREGHRAADGFARPHPYVFSQLHYAGRSLSKWPANPLVTREERTEGPSGTLRGRAMPAMRTSLRAPRVERFVIECIAPSCHVDIAGHPELVTPAPRDAVDSIMSIEGRGTRAEPRGNVQERKARNERGDAYFEGGLAS